MSLYRCPLFGQGHDSDLESPAGGIPLSQKELIPELSDSVGGYYPLAVARDQMAEYPANFTIPSASKWYWRVKTWTGTLFYDSGLEGVDTINGSFPLPGYNTAGLMTTEDELHSPLFGVNAHYRIWDAGVLFLPGPWGDNEIRCKLHIGAFGADSNYPEIHDGPTLNQLFLERTDGTFAPRIYVETSIFLRISDVEQLNIRGTSYGDGMDDFALTLDGLTIPGATSSDDLDTNTLALQLVPSAFFSWSGLWNTATGAALSNPRI